MTFVRSRYEQLGLEEDFYKHFDFHIHVPEGATPKDGPSAGVAIATAVISALTGIPVRRDVAMTGEITLRGRVLPVGGLNEKTVAALRAGVRKVLWPARNRKDLEELPKEVRSKVEIVFVDTVDEVLELALTSSLPTHVGGKTFSSAARDSESARPGGIRH